MFTLRVHYSINPLNRTLHVKRTSQIGCVLATTKDVVNRRRNISCREERTSAFIKVVLLHSWGGENAQN